MRKTDFRSVYFPYCLRKQEDGSYVVLNREYQPVGFSSWGNANYEDYPVRSKIKGITSNKAEKLAWDGNVQGNDIYLYIEGCAPTRSKKNMDSYLEKLVLLAKLRIEEN